MFTQNIATIKKEISKRLGVIWTSLSTTIIKIILFMHNIIYTIEKNQLYCCKYLLRVKKCIFKKVLHLCNL